MDPKLANLEYQRRGGLQRRWVARTALITAAVVAILTSIRMGPELWRRVQVMHWQRQCLDYQFPAGPVITADGKQQLTGPSQIRCWSEFDRLAGIQLRSNSIVFMHRLKTPGGVERLVVTNGGYAAGVGISFDAFAFQIEGMRDHHGSIYDHNYLLALSPMPFGVTSVIVYPGQVDPSDRSHFTFAIDTNLNRTIVDGWLRDLQGDIEIVLEERPPVPIPKP
jgi:hypothetical protein